MFVLLQSLILTLGIHGKKRFWKILDPFSKAVT